jgi:DKNYY family
VLKFLIITSIIFVVSFLLFFPFRHVGGHYYRGLLLIYDIRPKTSSGNFLPPLPFEKEITLLWWADPTSFEYFAGDYAKDRFSVYNQYRLDGFDPDTFRQLQAPFTGELYYGDKSNARLYDFLILKDISPNEREDRGEGFDMESFEILGANLIKDKNGVYSFSKTSWSLNESMHQPGGYDDRIINLFKKHENLDAETFKVNTCDKKNCWATDKNNKYILNRTISERIVNIKKIEQ